MKNFSSLEDGLKRSLVGASKAIVQRLEGYRRAGLDYVELEFMYATVSELYGMMNQFARDIIPSF